MSEEQRGRRKADHEEFANGLVRPKGVRLVYVALGFALTVILVVAVYVLSSNAAAHLNADEANGCYRLNIVRANDNWSHRQDWVFDKAVAAFLRGEGAQSGRASVGTDSMAAFLADEAARAATPEDAHSLRTVAAFLRTLTHRSSAAIAFIALTAQTVADEKSWVPLTDCHRALDNPSAYCPADRILFSVTDAPPEQLETPPFDGISDRRYRCGEHH